MDPIILKEGLNGECGGNQKRHVAIETFFLKLLYSSQRLSIIQSKPLHPTFKNVVHRMHTAK